MKKAFTLIELLVVIAIIAILAAILFPVFAQAKLAAKKTQALSSVKQLGLSVTIYLNDYDDNFPLAFQAYNWVGNDLWCQRVQPYVKSLGVLEATTDSYAGQTASVGSWAGIGVSFSANAYYGNWCCSPNWDSGFQLRGPMGIGEEPGDSGNGWMYGEELSATTVTQPAATILLAEKHGDDIAKWATAYGSASDNTLNIAGGNWSAFGPNGMIAGPNIDIYNGVDGWGPQAIPNAASTWWQTNGNDTQTQFEFGINGSVSASYAGQSNFVYTDGHAKSAVPSSTDPDPVNQPQNNQWDALR